MVLIEHKCPYMDIAWVRVNYANYGGTEVAPTQKDFLSSQRRSIFQTYKRSRNEDKYWSFLPTRPQIKKEYADEGQQQFTGLEAKESQVGVEQFGLVLLAAVTRQQLVTYEFRCSVFVVIYRVYKSVRLL